MYTLLPWLWHLLGAEPAGRKSAIVWSPSVFSRRFRGSCRNPDEVHGTLTARRQFPIHFSVGTDPDKKVTTLPRDRPTGKDKGLVVGHRIHMLSDPRYSQAGKSLAENRTTELGRRLSMKIRFSSEPSQPAPISADW